MVKRVTGVAGRQVADAALSGLVRLAGVGGDAAIPRRGWIEIGFVSTCGFSIAFALAMAT